MQALLGEMESSGGSAVLARPQGGVGFVAQEPWLQQGSIRDNITFGKAYQHTWYSKVTEACALVPDLASLAAGDLSKVGEGGSNLSGGQRARVALARAVYQDKELYIIDDIFSAVDGHVAAHIYRKLILGLLKDKTRILCTHQTRYLSGADNILVLEGGRIVDQGPPSKILPNISSKDSSVSATNFSMVGTPMDTTVQNTGRNSPTLEITSESPPAEEGKEEVEEEQRETGTVKFHVYKTYWRAVGCLLSPTILLSLLAMQVIGLFKMWLIIMVMTMIKRLTLQVTRNMTDLWLANWVGADSGNTSQPNTSSHTTNLTLMDYEDPDEVFYRDPAADSVRYYLTVYGSIAVANSLFSFMRAFLFAFGGVCAAKTVHTR